MSRIVFSGARNARIFQPARRGVHFEKCTDGDLGLDGFCCYLESGESFQTGALPASFRDSRRH